MGCGRHDFTYYIVRIVSFWMLVVVDHSIYRFMANTRLGYTMVQLHVIQEIKNARLDKMLTQRVD